MSSPARTRPPRDHTRKRLFQAASRIFAQQGVEGASIGQICSEAGFTRGAFYSNFRTKDELAVAMLDDHLVRSQQHNLALLERHQDPVTFIAALRADADREDDPLHDNPMLQVELLLYVARNPAHRHAVTEHLATMRALAGRIAATTLAVSRPDLSLDICRLGVALVALEDGLRLHRMLDPDHTPDDAYLDALELLQVLSTTPPSSRRRRRP